MHTFVWEQGGGWGGAGGRKLENILTVNLNTARVQALCLNEKANNTVEIVLDILVIFEGELEMIVEVTLPVLGEPQPISGFVLNLQGVGELEPGCTW